MTFEPKTVAFAYLDESQHDNAWMTPLIVELKDEAFAQSVCIHTSDMDLLGGADVVLDERGIIQVLITYPLSKPTTLTIHRDSAIDVKTFITAVASMYRAIYADEARSTRVMEGTVPGMLNRNKTDGKYGIWGHGIDDLFLEGAERKADGVWHLHIVS